MVQTSWGCPWKMARQVLFILTCFCVGTYTRAVGYGATTFPALTEALTIENNSTLAAYEAKRLQELIDQLTTSLHI